MQLEPIETNFTEVLDGVAFSMGYGGTRVVVIVANETLIRMGLPEDADSHTGFFNLNLAEWQVIADGKFSRGDFENRGSRVRIGSRDIARHRMRLAG